MAQIQLGDFLELGFVNAQRATASNGGSGDILNTPANYQDITALDAALTAFDAFTYSAANLQLLNVNDKIFALRSIQDRTSIADFQPAQTARTS